MLTTTSIDNLAPHWGMTKCGSRWVPIFTHPYDCKRKHPKHKKLSRRDMNKIREIIFKIASLS